MITHLEAVDELELSRFMGCSARSAHLERVVSFAGAICEDAWFAAVAHEDQHRGLLAA